MQTSLPTDPEHPSNTARLSQPRVAALEIQIDEVTQYEVSGWAWVPSSPNLRVEVFALLRNEVVGRAVADMRRSELGSKNYIPGPLGFRITFQRPLAEGDAVAIRAAASPALEHTRESGESFSVSGGSDTSIDSSLLKLLDDHRRFTAPGPEFEQLNTELLRGVTNGPCSPILLAFYFSQFHSIPENDKFWGTGFTEWRQLPKGLPRFPGHWQPRIPRDLGYYNLRHIESMRAQVEMARAGGIGCFAFYYYNFGGRRLLETPLDNFLSSDLDMPFVLIWVNETWTRAWGGAPHITLMKQTYDSEFERQLLDDFKRHIDDKRYLRLRGRPLLVVYHPKDVPESKASVARWRNRLGDRCGVEPLLFMAQTFGETDPNLFGYDGALEFPPHKLLDRVFSRPAPDAYSDAFAGRIVKYDDFVNASLAEEGTSYPLIKTAVPSWDNEPRYPNKALTLEGVSPQKYEAWLTALLHRAVKNPVFDTPIVAVNAWNEWAEGATLEPDVYFGSAFLNATARAYRSVISMTRTA